MRNIVILTGIGIGLIAFSSFYLKKGESPLIETIAFQESSIKKMVNVKKVPNKKREEITDKEKDILLITKKVETEFLSLELPKQLPKEKAKRYHLLYANYLKASFFINEAAAGNLTLSRETLYKAFKVILQYIHENSAEDIASALSMLREDYPELFQEALKELESHQEEKRIEALLALND